MSGFFYYFKKSHSLDIFFIFQPWFVVILSYLFFHWFIYSFYVWIWFSSLLVSFNNYFCTVQSAFYLFILFYNAMITSFMYMREIFNHFPNYTCAFCGESNSEALSVSWLSLFIPFSIVKLCTSLYLFSIYFLLLILYHWSLLLRNNFFACQTILLIFFASQYSLTP